MGALKCAVKHVAGDGGVMGFKGLRVGVERVEEGVQRPLAE